MATNVEQFISDLDAGVLEEKLSAMLSDVASAVIDYERKGEVNIKLKFERIGTSSQVKVEHTLSYKRPTSKGTITEDNTTSTPMYVGTRGALTLFPENQLPMFDKKGAVVDRETGEIKSFGEK